MMKKRLRRSLCCLLLCGMLMPCLAAGATAGDFADVPESHWAAESVRRCAELGFFRGETATVFGMGKSINRAAFVVVLSRFFGWEVPAVKESSYTDVPADAWYAGAVEAALQNGAITKQTDTFRPADPLSREELAVILIRALGYTSLAGLAQDLPSTFEDVTTNPGYIALSKELGLVTGTTAASFAPDRAATRETVAVILMRLYDKLHAATPEKVGIVYSAEDLPDLTGFGAVAVSGGQLINIGGGGTLTGRPTAEEVDPIRAAVAESGAKQLLYAWGSSQFLRADAAKTAKTLAETVTAEGYDGLFLDIKELNILRNELTSLVTALRKELGEKKLYVAVTAPVWQSGRTYQGYDYAELGKQVDRLVLRVAAYDTRIGKTPIAPMEPLEEVYYALAQIGDVVDAEKLSLMLTTTAVVRGAGGSETIPGSAVEAKKAEEGVSAHYADRYACAYLSAKSETIWYLDERAGAERVNLLRCFGVDQICLERLNGISPELLKGLK